MNLSRVGSFIRELSRKVGTEMQKQELLGDPARVSAVGFQAMTRGFPLNLDRNYPALFLALDEVLELIEQGGPDEDALRRSFEGLADGFGVEKALLLVVEKRAPLRLRAVESRGLSVREIAACERGWSVPGVSSSRIREAVVRGVPVMVQDSELLTGTGVTEALRGKPASVLCAPICEPRSGQALAVLYAQNHGVRSAFGEIDRAWIEVYARALGRVLSGALDRRARADTSP
jgi:hypothetical protein